MRSVMAVVFGTMLCFVGACNGIGAIGERKPERQTGGVAIAFVAFAAGVPLLIAGARRKTT